MHNKQKYWEGDSNPRAFPAAGFEAASFDRLFTFSERCTK
jgi:hypothetical protein